MTNEKQDGNSDDIDRADVSLREGKFSIKGARNGKLSLCVGIAIIIGSLGWAIANVVDSIWSK